MKETNLEIVANKVFTILTSRRFWNSVFSIVFLLVAGPEAAEHADSLSPQAVDIVTMLFQIVGPILVLLGLNISWTSRAPVKTDYKNADDLGTVLNTLVEK
jgi:uncharacterized membrane protein YphA (DoxX/SURF4 family)